MVKAMATAQMPEEEAQDKKDYGDAGYFYPAGCRRMIFADHGVFWEIFFLGKFGER